MKLLKTYMIAFFFIGFFIALQFQGFVAYAQAEAIKPFLLDPVSTFLDNKPALETGKPTIKEVKDYMKTIFGASKGELLWRISQNECSTKRPEWPNCLNSWGYKGSNKGEYSVGILQINIAKEGGKGPWVHWNKIPGNNLDEKQAYLMDYKHSILIAYVISQGGTNFEPWTGFKMLKK